MARWIDIPKLTEPRLLRRLAQLFVGLVAFGVSVALMVRSRLGLAPWDVFHQGVARQTGVQLGWVVVAVSIAVLVLWIPLRQRLGIGTLANAVIVGVSVNLALTFLPVPHDDLLRALLLISGVVANGIATGLYIGAGLGPGPRDGLMIGIAGLGHSIRSTRTVLEISVLLLGWALGGTVGIGTAFYALAIGPLAHYFIPRFSLRSRG